MDIEKLKENWLNDPCWDIEGTEGYEAHYDELLAFRLKKQAEWEAKRKEEIATRRIQTIRTSLFKNGDQYVISEDVRVSALMNDGWVIADISVTHYTFTGGDWPIEVVDRWVTLTRELPSSKIDPNADLDARIAASQ